jgi:hypothetical protein
MSVFESSDPLDWDLDRLGPLNAFVVASALAAVSVFAAWVPATNDAGIIATCLFFGFTSGAWVRRRRVFLGNPSLAATSPKTRCFDSFRYLSVRPVCPVQQGSKISGTDSVPLLLSDHVLTFHFPVYSRGFGSARVVPNSAYFISSLPLVRSAEHRWEAP